MAGAATIQRSGVMSWVSSIRTTMANDPGRQFLEDQIQSNGFLFLEDYLDNILAGPRHDPIIELVKTPGRKRDAPKKTRAATAAADRAKAIIAMSLEDDDDFDKENQAPIVNATPMNAFHRALLKSKDENADDGLPQDEGARLDKAFNETTMPASSSKTVVISTPERKVRVQETVDEEEDEEMAVEELVTPPHAKLQYSMEQESERLPAPSFLHGHTKELSIIAEDDELADRSEIVVEPHAVLPLADSAKDDSKPISPVDNESRDQQHPPTEIVSEEMPPMDVDIPTQSEGLPHSPVQSSQKDRSAEGASQQTDSASETAKLSVIATHQEDTVNFRFLPHAAAAHTDDENEDDTLERKLRLKTTMPHFPSLGAPSPVRMSMRAPREPSVAAGQTTTKATLTRSSWLVKAKEAKAIEENAKRMSGLPGAGKTALQTATASKRKSGEMLGLTPTGDAAQDSSERKQKVTKIAEENTPSVTAKDQENQLIPDQTQPHINSDANAFEDELMDMEDSGHNPEGMMDKLRKTVAGFSARAGKSMGKSLGGAAATALAEARAAAEAKIAERHAAEGRVAPAASTPTVPLVAEVKEPTPVFTRPPPEKTAPTLSHAASRESERRLSVSDLVTKYETTKKKLEVQEPVFRPPPVEQKGHSSRLSNTLADISTSTTPPDSPPRTRQPVFSLNKPTVPPVQAVFVPPPPRPQQTVEQSTSHLNTMNAFEARVFNTGHPQPLSSHSTLVSTQTSIFSDGIFDHTPSWGPSTQDTELFEDPVPSQEDQYKYFGAPLGNQDSDGEGNESWHLDGKFTATWTPNINMHVREDEMTWNSAFSRSSNDTDSRKLDASMPPPSSHSQGGASTSKLPALGHHDTEEDGRDEDDMDIEEDDEDLGAIRLVPSASQSTTSLVSQSKTHSRSESQQSQHSATNGTSQLGFFSSATKFVSSVLGGSKKKEPVKSLQLAAAAAKKQQEEAEKKAARLKDMDARRQQALQKKAEEDKAREEKRIREEDERWKREREKEDTTEKRILKQPGKKLTQMEDDLTKKKEIAKADKAETKKPPSKDKKDMAMSKVGKPANASQTALNTSIAPSKSSKLNAWANSSTTTTFKMADMTIDAKSTLASSMAPSKTKGKGKAIDDLDDNQPAKFMQAQMQARVQAQIKEAKKDSPRVASENIELPDIQSEYSDSDDEDRRKDLPNWVQSPELQAALRQQSTVDPDDIFGAIKPLKMEELFKNRTSRFRARTSSANWAGTDEVTAAEEREYARRMGYTK